MEPGSFPPNCATGWPRLPGEPRWGWPSAAHRHRRPACGLGLSRAEIAAVAESQRMKM